MLSEEQRNLINYKLQGHTNAEIAQLLKINTATVESRWRRLCGKLRKLQAQKTETYR
jgi:DNA-binding CsgD family transcriptional regulator